MSYCPPSAVLPADERLRADRLGWFQRTAMIAGGTVLISLLIVAAVLRPNPRGMGTHRQLGLPPCSMVVLAGIRCPSCGMTTSWSRVMRGNLVGAVRANSGGTLLALAAIASGPWLVVSGLAGRWKFCCPDERTLVWIGLIIIAVTLIDWTLRLKLGL